MGKITITKQIGKAKIGYIGDSGESDKESLAQGAAIATMPDHCTICGKDDVTLDSNRTAEGYLYVKIRCLNEKCKAQATAGEYRDKSGIFWKAFEKYEPKDNSSSESSEKEEKKETKKTTKKAEDDDDDFNF